MTFTEQITLEALTCGKCGGTFALTQRFLEHGQANGGGYTCPYCGMGWHWREPEVVRLRKQLEEKARELTAAKCETLRQTHLAEAARTDKEKAEKKLRRVQHGVCPECKRHFTNLSRHMATKHGTKT